MQIALTLSSPMHLNYGERRKKHSSPVTCLVFPSCVPLYTIFALKIYMHFSSGITIYYLIVQAVEWIIHRKPQPQSFICHTKYVNV